MAATDRLFAALALTFLPVAAQAECFICDTVVEFDAAGLACFRDKAETFLEAARNDPGQRTEVNLVTCGDPNGRGLDTFPSPEDIAKARDDEGTDEQMASADVRQVYFLDVTGIECLISLLAGLDGMPGRIDLTSDCR